MEGSAAISHSSAHESPKKRLLVVEDDSVNVFYISSLLKDRDIIYDIANDGIEAMEKIDQNDYDLILMDLQMPRMDGYEAIFNIRGKKQVWSPLIIMTASTFNAQTFPEDLEGLHHGFITKPIAPKQLEELLNREVFTPKLSKLGEHIEKHAAGDQKYKRELCELLIQNFVIYSHEVLEAVESKNYDLFNQASHKIGFSIKVLKMVHLNLLIEQILPSFLHGFTKESPLFKALMLSLEHIVEAIELHLHDTSS